MQEALEEAQEEEIADLLEIPLWKQETVYKYTSTSFWYIGQFFHEKSVDFFGGNTYFLVRGTGETRGHQSVHTVKYPGGEKVNIDNRFWGRTDHAPSAEAAALEREMIDYIEGQRISAIEALNEKLRTNPELRANAYFQELKAINDYFDDMISKISEGYELAKKNVTLITEIEVLSKNLTTIRTGVEMNPGEEGYIIQSVAANRDLGGEYLKFSNSFGNTGGVTRRTIEIGNFLSEKMHVRGSAVVREHGKIEDGGAATGWWDLQP